MSSINRYEAAYRLKCIISGAFSDPSYKELFMSLSNKKVHKRILETLTNVPEGLTLYENICRDLTQETTQVTQEEPCDSFIRTTFTIFTCVKIDNKHDIFRGTFDEFKELYNTKELCERLLATLQLINKDLQYLEYTDAIPDYHQAVYHLLLNIPQGLKIILKTNRNPLYKKFFPCNLNIIKTRSLDDIKELVKYFMVIPEFEVLYEALSYSD
jgi:hypothetical protein